MDVDELLARARLEDAGVDTDAALARTASRWRARRQRRLAALGVVLVVVVAGVALAVTAGDDDRPVDVHTGTTTQPAGSGSWRVIAPAPLSPRKFGVAAWTGDEMIVVGGSTSDPCDPFAYCTDRFDARADGAAYDPESDSWRRIADAPGPLVDGTAAWTGSRLLLAAIREAPGVRAVELYSYDPGEDRWATIPPPEGVAADDLGYPVWTGFHWIFPLWPAGSSGTLHGYDPARGEWSFVASDPLGPAGSRQLVWTGEDLVVIADIEGLGSEPGTSGVLAYALDPNGDRPSRRLPTPHLDAGSGPWIAAGDLVVDPDDGAWDVAKGTWTRNHWLRGAGPSGGRTMFTGYAGGWVVVDSWLLGPHRGEVRAVDANPGRQLPAVAVWTGDEIISWGGVTDPDDPELVATGAAYRPPSGPDPVEPSPTRPTPSTEPRPCDSAPGSMFDLGQEPSNDVGFRRWTDREGCMVRLDRIADRHWPEHCGWENVRVITLEPDVLGILSRRTSYVRDPDGVLGRPELVQDLDLDADLPSPRLETGFRSRDEDLVMTAWDGAIWIRSDDHVERWPAAEPPICD
jgi:hypothetical protein